MKKNYTIFLFIFALFSNFTFAQNPTISPQTLSLAFAEIAKKAEPAVVNIDTKSKGTTFSLNGENIIENGDDKSELARQTRRPQFSVGSGFIVDSKGYILTNAHVVDDAIKITVSLKNGDKFLAKVIGTDQETDIAVLKIEAGRELPILKLADSEAIEVGEWVLAIGSPFGLEQTVTAGIISKVKRSTPFSTPFQKFVQTDAAINRGNSGGPLVNLKGEVVGINSQIATASGESNGIGFALPSNDVLYVYKQILANGLVKRGYLGVVLDSVKQEFATVYGLPTASGAIITEMRDSESAAGKAGLLVNDIITEFDGKKVENATDMISKVAGSEPGKDYSAIYYREIGANLERRTTTIKLAERPSNNKIIDNDIEKKTLGAGTIQPPILALVLSDITPAIAKLQGIEGKKGILVKEISPDSILAEVTNATGGIALKPGDIIQRLNRQEITTVKAFTEIEKKLKKGDAVVLHILSLTDRISKIYQTRIVQFTIQ
jgi:serine protease Do